jgi:hypothetical protein
MGIIIDPLYMKSTGRSVSNAYAAFARNDVVLQPTDGGYVVQSSYGIWKSEADRRAGHAALTTGIQGAFVNFSAISTCLRELYGSLKSTFPSYTNVLEPGQTIFQPAISIRIF